MITGTRTADEDIVRSWIHCIRLAPVRYSYISAWAIRVDGTLDVEESWNREAVKKTVTDRSWSVHDVCHTGESVNAATIVAAYSTNARHSAPSITEKYGKMKIQQLAIVSSSVSEGSNWWWLLGLANAKTSRQRERVRGSEKVPEVSGQYKQIENHAFK